MKRLLQFCILSSFFLLNACKTSQPGTTRKDDGKIDLVLVQVNDVYEIAPLSGGKEGGMARVATLKKELLRNNPNTFLFMAGDFVSPSIYNSLQHEGKAIRGKQMIEAMNAAGVDFVVPGNHEFDIRETELQDRINESKFVWIATNTFHKKGSEIQPFAKTNEPYSPFPKYKIIPVSDADGTTARIAIIGLTLPANKADYVHYTDVIAETKTTYNLLKDSADAIIALTHQFVAEDIQLAREVPGLALIMGGHEHDQQFRKVGKVFVTKAHSNARSAYVVRMQVNKKTGKVKVNPELRYINQTIALDSAADVVVQKWISIAENSFSASGFDARKIVLSKGEPLEGRETEIRHRSTNLTRLVVAAMEDAAPAADLALLNSGSIRVDDILQLPVSQYDILRALPFGGALREADIKGSLLQQVLTAGKGNKGNGGFLQYSQTVTSDASTGDWLYKGAPILPEKIYRVVMSDYLFSGRETNLTFLNATNAAVVKAYAVEKDLTQATSDIRLAIVRYLQKKQDKETGE
ncbi:MAG: 5'-nucleotidase C-terminal domain-containing protein [Chitinophagaceae bacterium]